MSKKLSDEQLVKECHKFQKMLKKNATNDSNLAVLFLWGNNIDSVDDNEMSSGSVVLGCEIDIAALLIEIKIKVKGIAELLENVVKFDSP